MLLENLIEHLEHLDPNAVIKFNGNTLISGFNSYRGIYAHLCIEPASETETDPVEIVEDLLALANDANGETYEGYKGGHYTMGDASPIWLSKYGEASGVALTDIVPIEGDQGQLLLYVLKGSYINDYLF